MEADSKKTEEERKQVEAEGKKIEEEINAAAHVYTLDTAREILDKLKRQDEEKSPSGDGAVGVVADAAADPGAADGRVGRPQVGGVAVRFV